MQHHEPSTLLATAEIVHWIALASWQSSTPCGCWWLFSFRPARDRSAPGKPGRTNAHKGGLLLARQRRHALGHGEHPREGLRSSTSPSCSSTSASRPASPWPSSAPCYRPLVETPAVAWLIGGAHRGGLPGRRSYRIVRRVQPRRCMRLISTPDDYFSLFMLTVWFLLGVLAQAHIAGSLRFASESYLVAFLIATSFFLLYVPFSKISHYLYYPFTRYWIGKALGHRGSMPYASGLKERHVSKPAEVLQGQEDRGAARQKKLTRQVVGSLVGCVHCGMCNEACHYVLAIPDDPKMTPSYKADQLRKIFKRNHDWTGRVFPWWVRRQDAADRRGPRGAQGHRLRHLHQLPALHLQLPHGRRHRDAQPHHARPAHPRRRHARGRAGGQQGPVGDRQPDGRPQGGLPRHPRVDVRGAGRASSATTARRSRSTRRARRSMYTINPREVKYDPRTIKAAALIFYAAGEDWTMPSEGWDQTNFGLFSGDDQLGGVVRQARLREGRGAGRQAAGHLRVRPRLPLDPLRGAELGRRSTSASPWRARS